MSTDVRKFGDEKVFHEWHRPASLGRFLERSERFTMVDIDAVEYCPRCQKPLRIMETARDVGQAQKHAWITARIARERNVPAAIVLCTLDDAETDIVAFRVMQISPTRSAWIDRTPEEFALTTEQVYARHDLECPNPEPAGLSEEQPSPVEEPRFKGRTVTEQQAWIEAAITGPPA